VITLGDLAHKLGLSLRGDPSLVLHGLAPLDTAASGELSFFSDKRYLKHLTTTRASALIIAPEFLDDYPDAALISDNPYLSYAHASVIFDDRPTPKPGIHASAVVEPGVDLGVGVSIGAHSSIGEGSVLGDQVVIGPGTIVGPGCRIGARSQLYARVVLYDDVVLGVDCRVHSGAVLGADGFGYAPNDGGWSRIHQLGGVRLGDRVEVGANTCIDRGALGNTVLADDVIIDNQVQIAHNVEIGKGSAVAACTGIAGSTSIGSGCTIAGAVGIVGHLNIVDNVHITAMSLVTRSIDSPGSYSSGTQIGATREWRRNAVRFSQLDTMHRRLQELEKLLS
jgi:UDP-3-O-[3-hydroxymyristoyl] glucosamine N-acyltransferase